MPIHDAEAFLGTSNRVRGAEWKISSEDDEHRISQPFSMRNRRGFVAKNRAR